MVARASTASPSPLHDWEPDYRLGDGCKVKHGFAFKGAFMTTDEVDGPVVVNIVNFQYTGGFRFNTTKVQRYTGPYPRDYELKAGDVLLVMTCQTAGGEILGVPGRVPAGPDVYVHNQRLGLLELMDDEALDLGFLYWLALSPTFNRHLYETATGAKILHTAPTRIEDYRFARPPLSTQRRIAFILDAYEDLIENNARRIAVLEEMARSLYREWFVNFRFPGHEAVGMVESPLGPVPDGWRVTSLKEVAHVNGESLKPKDAPERINYIDIASVSPGRIDVVQPMRFDDAPGRARRVVHHGDTIWSNVRPNRRSFALIIDPASDVIVSTGFSVLSPIAVPFSFLHLAVTTDEFVGYLTSHATGAAYPAVTAKDFEIAALLVPSRKLADAFHTAVADMLVLCHELRQKNAVLRATRDLLLPRLISGELDLSDLDIDTGELSA